MGYNRKQEDRKRKQKRNKPSNKARRNYNDDANNDEWGRYSKRKR